MHTEHDAGRRPPVALALAVAVVAIGFAGPFFRKADPTHPLVKSGLRLAMAALVFAPFVLRGRLTPRQIRAGVAAGALYGLHFGSWVWSLGLTSMAASVTLVTSTPLMLASAALLTGRDRPTPRLWLALGLATVGVACIGGFDLGGGHANALLGDALALLGAAAMAGYLALARRLGTLDVLAFSGVATAVGAACLLGAAAALGHPPVAASWGSFGWLVAATGISQLIGHTLITWSLRHTTPTVVGLATVGEPVVATALAWLWLAEAPSGLVLLGSAVTLAAVVLALRR
ncbi:MAG: DMT family transporter [Myxococcales bacterium]|nr:DMT family transporter [Myxococcales bacterium]